MKHLLLSILSVFLVQSVFSQEDMTVHEGLLSVKDGAFMSVHGDARVSLGATVHNSDTIYLFQDWINNSGGAAFSSYGLGYVRLFGDDQRIRGLDTTVFSELWLEQTGIKYADIEVLIDTRLLLNDREFSLDSHVVRVRNPALTSVPTTGGFVSSIEDGGLLRYTGQTSDYYFPVGSSLGTTRFRPLTITPTQPNMRWLVRMANVDATIEGFDRSVRDSFVCEVNPDFYHRVYRDSGVGDAALAIHYESAVDGLYDDIGHWQNIPQWESIGPATVGFDPIFNHDILSVGNHSDFAEPAFALIDSAEEQLLTASPNPACQDSTITISAAGGFAQYDFYVNGILVQSSTDSFYINSFSDGDIVNVIIDDAACIYRTNSITLQVFESSVSLAASDTSVCPGTGVIFTTTSGFDIYDFYVNGILIQSSNSQTFIHVPLNDGDIISVIVTNTTTGCQYTSDDLIMTVFENSVTLTASDTTICPSETIQFAASGAFELYEFYVNGNLVQSSPSSGFISSSINNGDIITVTATDSTVLCTYTSNQIQITVYDNTVNLNAFPQLLCPGDTTLLQATLGFDNYQFIQNGIIIQAGSDPFIQTNSITNGDSIYVISTDNSVNCSYTSNVIIMTVYDEQVELTASPTTACPDEQVTFTATTGFDVYYFLVNGVQQQVGPSNIFNTTTLSNNDVVQVVAENTTTGCSYSSAFIQMTILEDGVDLVLSDDEICEGEILTATATSGFDTYDFSVDGLLVQSGSSPIFNTSDLSDGDIIFVTAYASGCSYSNASLQITVFPGVSITAYGDTTIAASTSATIGATGAQGYSWTPTDDLSCANCPEPIATPTAPTTFTVVGFNDFGCTDTAQVFIDLVPYDSNLIFVPNALTPNGDGKNDTWEIIDLNTLFPDNEVVILNRYGDEVFEQAPYLNGFDGRYGGGELPAGTYYFILNLGNNYGVIKGDLTIIRE